MGNIITVRNVKIGEGIPKLCVPIVGKTREEILKEASTIKEANADIVEWRVDWFEKVSDFSDVKEMALELREVLEEMPILFTFRTAKEGGEREINENVYCNLNLEMAASGLVDLIDLELSLGEEKLKRVIWQAHLNGVKVIVSNHEFYKTPSKEEMTARLYKMQQLGADIEKLAVMPQSKRDVMELMLATMEMKEQCKDSTLITMAMGKQGAVSRVCGEFFGSALTFGAVEKASAPGQIPAQDLQEILQMMHHIME